MFADEAVGRCAESKSEAEEVVEETSGGGVENVGEHDVHGVLSANRTSTKHSETKLHRENEIC